MRRRLLLIDAVRHAVPRTIAPPLKWLRLRLFERREPKAWFSPAFLTAALRHRYRLATFERRFHSAHARAVYIEARSKYQVQCMEWNNKAGALHGLDAAFPFLDRDLIAYLMAIPGEMHARDGVPRALLREAMRGILPESIRARTWKSDFSASSTQGWPMTRRRSCARCTPECLGVRFGYLDRGAPGAGARAARRELNGPECADSWDLGRYL